MRMFFIFIGLLYCIPCMGYIVTNKTCGLHEGNETDCLNTPGCDYYNGDCIQCDFNFYCPGGGGPKSCSSETANDFPNSLRGATDKTDCYKDGGGCYEPNGNTNTNCGLFYDGGTFGGGTGIPKCWTANGQYLTDYHTEGQDNLCYANTRNCGLFSYDLQVLTNNSSCTITYNGLAYWENNKYTFNNCTVNATNCLYSDHNCFATAELSPTQNTSLSSVAINEFNEVPLTLNRYFCSSCDDGYYVTEQDLQLGHEQEQGGVRWPKCYNQPSTGDYVCNCTITPKGYYVEQCSWNGNITQFANWQNECLKKPCPAGKTTDNPGASEAGDCQYTNQTKFCDSKGCFTLPDIGGVANWAELP